MPDELCECGCGQITPRALQSDTSRGYVKGYPKRFVTGHNALSGKKRKWKDSRGYMMAWIPGRGSVRWSNIIAEQMLQRPLQPNEEVHHINGVKDDDRPSNLLVTSHAEHMRIHKVGRPFSAEHRAALRQAWVERRRRTSCVN